MTEQRNVMDSTLTFVVVGCIPEGYTGLPAPAEDETVDDGVNVLDDDGEDTDVSVQVGADYLIVNRWNRDHTEMTHWPPREWNCLGLRGEHLEALRRDLEDALAGREPS